MNFINKKIYISGKITGAPNLNYKKFEDAEVYIEIELGGYAVNPHHLPDDHDKSWFSYMRVCVANLVKCDLVFALDDWKQSRGATREILIAQWLLIPVLDIKNKQLIRIGFFTKIKLLLNLI